MQICQFAAPGGLCPGMCSGVTGCLFMQGGRSTRFEQRHQLGGVLLLLRDAAQHFQAAQGPGAHLSLLAKIMWLLGAQLQ